ncbi:MAG TPA: O-antigen ligase family protein [Thermoanaerobaculia bacterium]|nr:O-antigen ligase family protein [Thermoanaerobaculia bacterium]
MGPLATARRLGWSAWEPRDSGTAPARSSLIALPAPLARMAACLLVCAVSFDALADLPSGIVAPLAASAVAIALLTAWLSLKSRSLRDDFELRPQPGLVVEPLLLAASLGVVSLAAAAVALATLPPRLFTLSFLPLRHLDLVIWTLFLGLIALFAHAVCRPRGGRSLAEAALVCLVVHATLNGDLYGLLGTARAPLLFGMTVLAAAAVLRRPRAARPPPRAIAAWATAFLATAVLASLAGVDPHEGLVRTAALANWIAAAAVLACGVESRREARRLVFTMLLTAGLVALSSLVGTIEMAIALGPQSLLGVQQRVARTNANGSGLYAAVSLILCVGVAGTWRRSRRGRVLLAIVMPLLAAVFFLSYSKAAAAGFAVGLGVLVFGSSSGAREAGATRRRFAVGALFAVVALAAGVFERDPEPGIRSRVVLWKQAARIVAARPLLGIGPGDAFPPAFDAGMDAKELGSVRMWFTHSHPHNLLLAVAVATGLLGLAAFVGLGVAAFREVARSISKGPPSSRTLVLALSAALAAWAVDHMGVLVASERSLVGDSFFLLLALAVAAGRSMARRPGGRSPLGASLLVGAASLAVALPCASERLAQRGEGAFRGGRAADARRLFGWAARLAPFDAELLDRWGALEADSRLAAVPWRHAAALRPEHAPYQDRLGWLAWLEGDVEGAERAFTEATRLDPAAVDGGPYQAHLGYLAFHRGDRRAAVARLRDAAFRSLRFVDAEDWPVDASGSDVALSPAYRAGSAAGNPALRSALLRHLGRTERAEPPPAAAPGDVTLQEIVRGCLAESRPSPRDGTLLSGTFGIYEARALARRRGEICDATDARFSPSEPLARAMRFRLARDEGRFAEAARLLEGLVASSPHSRLRVDLVSALAAAGDVPGAAKEARALLHDRSSLSLTSPLAGDLWLEISGALERAGSLPEALEAAERASFTSPDAAVHARSRVAVERIRAAARRGVPPVNPPPP